MRKKILGIFLIILLLFTNYAFTVEALSLTYTREGGQDISNVARIINDDIYLYGEYNLYSVKVPMSNIEIYEYESTTKKTIYDNSELANNSNSLFYGRVQCTDSWYEYHAFMKIPEGEVKIENVATIIYKNAVKSNGLFYNMKINVKEISKLGSSPVKFGIAVANSTTDRGSNPSEWAKSNDWTLPAFRVHQINGTDAQIQAKLEISLFDNLGNEKNINGLFGHDDLDVAQGVAIENFQANGQNIFMYDENNPRLKYKMVGNNTYIYTTTIDDTPNIDNVYALMTNKKSVSEVITWDYPGGLTMVNILKDIIKRYYNIDTQVVGGTITPQVTGIRSGENRTITYSPNDSSRQYLKSVTVDGVEQSVDLFKNSYTFSNITDGHTIRVEYADLYKVTFDAKGGAPTPETQYVKGGETATEPSTIPTKNGYTFEGWTLDGGSSPYNFADPVNKDIKLVAKWKPIAYKIDYVLNGGTNAPENPTTYTREDTIDFNPATREGYDFLGWYEDENFTTPIAGVSNRTGDITVYAKWEAKKDVAYKVEHYKEKEAGKYELAVTDTLSGRTNEEVTAMPKTYTGYEENKTHKDRIEKGSIKADGSLVLKLYYDKIKYTVTFDPQNDTQIPDQIVPYQDKATEPKEPTKKDNEFKGWYYINEEGQEVIYNFDDPVTSDVHLIGKWAKIEKPVDATPAPTPIPQTGDFNPAMLFSIVAMVTLTGALGFRYLKFKREIK